MADPASFFSGFFTGAISLLCLLFIIGTKLK